MTPNLVVRNPDGSTRSIPVSRKPITVGRAETCDIVLPFDHEVSREHARVWLDEQSRILVQDYRSKNGTRVDGGDPFHNAVRAARHSIRIGEYELEIVHPKPWVRHESEGVAFTPDTATDNTQFFPSTRGLDLNQQRLALLMSLTERIGGAFELKQMLEQALDACCEALGFERGLLALKTQRGEPELPITRNVQRDETGAFKISRTLINKALVEGQRAVVNNPAVDLADNLSESLVRFPICSALCVPIMHREQILGVVYGDRTTHGTTYSSEDVDFLAAIARQVGVGIENLRLFQSQLDMERMRHELAQARIIQQRLLPDSPLLAGRIALAGHNEPSAAVGGDYFDYFPLADGQVGFTVADVTGHGLAAALIMANLQAAVRVALTPDAPLPEIVGRLNDLICRNTEASTFITGIFGRICAETGVVEYVNAGHPAPLLIRGQRVAPDLDGFALPLGIEPDERYTLRRIEPDGELRAALFYTDGLIEAQDAQGALLHVEPVVEALAGLRSWAPDQLLRHTLGLVKRHLAGRNNADDLTLLGLQYKS